MYRLLKQIIEEGNFDNSSYEYPLWDVQILQHNFDEEAMQNKQFCEYPIDCST